MLKIEINIVANGKISNLYGSDNLKKNKTKKTPPLQYSSYYSVPPTFLWMFHLTDFKKVIDWDCEISNF